MTNKFYSFVRGRRRAVILLLVAVGLIFFVDCYPKSHSDMTRVQVHVSSVTEVPANNYIPSQSWETPFSFLVSSADIDVVVLPLLEERCPVYAYFDPEEIEAQGNNVTLEKEIVQAWRKAFWSAGFKPVLLNIENAKTHKKYTTLDRLGIPDEHRKSLLRLMAYSSVPTGILTSHRIIPMIKSPADEQLLFLRSCKFSRFSIYKDLGTNLIFGSTESVDELLRRIFSSERISHAIGQMKGSFHTESKIGQFADYSYSYVSQHYQIPQYKVPDLIRAHLHSNFMSQFPGGVSVVNPFPDFASSITYPSIATANALIKCPPTDLDATCPSNIPKCFHCNGHKYSLQLVTSVPDSTSSLFSLITLPHPMTLLALTHHTDNINADFVRRKTLRDQWLIKATQSVVDREYGAPERALQIKKLAVVNSIILKSAYISTFEEQWNLANCEVDSYFSWAAGFDLPRVKRSSQKEFSDLEVSSFPEVLSAVSYCVSKEDYEHFVIESETKRPDRTPDRDVVKTLSDILTTVKSQVLSKTGTFIRTRKMVEAWNIADSEVWKFVKALNERTMNEERLWEERLG
ncbi:hypothetical protein V1514DRAFT_334321 [Lipomyces japonicus]|uniref:uncharacterized protein n=1 Tax=Lipomyces japonicus TaxID=56871 RepID=UPI0034CEB5C4